MNLYDPRLVTADTPSVLSAYWENPWRRYGASSPTCLHYISPSWSGHIYGWIVDTDQDTFKELVIARMRAGRQSCSSAEELSGQISISRIDPFDPIYLRYVEDLPKEARKYLKDTGQSWRGEKRYPGQADEFDAWRNPEGT